MAKLVSRAWNGTPISRRTTDGYVNATAMCKANGKRWKDYRESDRCQHYLDALESVDGNSGHALVESRSGGAGGGGTTWVHPQVAVDLARWISAPFAVWMDGWFLEEVDRSRVSQVRDTRKPLSLNQVGAEVIAARVQSNKDIGSMAKANELPYAATHQVRNNNFWDETTESLRDRAGTRNWQDRADRKTQMFTWYVNEKIMEEASEKENDGLRMTLGDVKVVSRSVRAALEVIEGTGFRAKFMPASISPARANRMLSAEKGVGQGSLFG